MYLCKDCIYFREDGFCWNPLRTKREVGYFQNQCGGFVLSLEAKLNEYNNKKMKQEKTQSTKTCKDCGRELPLTQFTKTRNGNYGTLCKECKGKRIKAAMKVNGIPAHQAEVETTVDTPAAIQDALAAAAGNIARRKKTISSASDAEIIDELKYRGFSGRLQRTENIEL